MLRLAKLAVAVSLSSVEAANWAVLVAGSKGFENYRHQSDVFHMYHILMSKGFHQDHIITLAYDDAKDDSENPFPGQIFNVPDPEGPGVDVRAGVKVDYAGDAVTVANFAGVLLGNGTSGGSGRVLDLAQGDHVFVLYVDHGAPGILEFPDGDTLHATEFQDLLTQMHSQGKYGRMVVYIEACESGSILEGLPTDLNIYGVTAVGPKRPSLGTYCGYEAVIGGKQMGTCLGDLFAVFFMKYISEGDGSRTMGSFFSAIFDQVATFAALHYGHQEGQQFGDIAGFKNLPLSEFFHADSQNLGMTLPSFVRPKEVLSATRAEVERLQQKYTEAAALPLEKEDGEWTYQDLRRSTNLLQRKLKLQERIQKTYWKLVKLAFPNHGRARKEAWMGRAEPRNPTCEKAVHQELVKRCGEAADMTTAYSMQFHQVVVNLCGDESIGWDSDIHRARGFAAMACSDVQLDDVVV